MGRLWYRSTAPIAELGIDERRIGCEIAIDEARQRAERFWDRRLKELPVGDVLPYIADGRLVLDA